MSDTGVAPGAGVGNCRMMLDEENLGIPVIAIGVPFMAFYIVFLQFFGFDSNVVANRLSHQLAARLGKDTHMG